MTFLTMTNPSSRSASTYQQLEQQQQRLMAMNVPEPLRMPTSTVIIQPRDFQKRISLTQVRTYIDGLVVAAMNLGPSMNESTPTVTVYEAKAAKSPEPSGLDEKEIQFDARRLRIRRAAKAFSESTHADY